MSRHAKALAYTTIALALMLSDVPEHPDTRMFAWPAFVFAGCAFLLGYVLGRPTQEPEPTGGTHGG